MKKRISNRRGEINGGPPVIGEAERPDAFARIAQVVAAAQDRILHLIVGERLRTDEHLLANVLLSLIGRHQYD